MKKSLSLILALTLVFSMFANVALGATAELDTQAKFEVLKEKGILNTAEFDRNMTRAEFAKVVALLAGLKENAAAAANYKDKVNGKPLASNWAVGYIGAVTEAKLMEGANGLFNPTANVTVQEAAKVLVLALGLKPVADAKVEGTSAWAAGYVQAAIDAKLIAAGIDFKAAAKRELLVNAAYSVVEAAKPALTVKSAKALDAKTVEVTFSDDKVEKFTLETALVAGKETEVTVKRDGVEYKVKVTLPVVGAAATIVGSKKVEVKFGAPVDEAKAVFAVKKGSVNMNVAAKSYNADKTAATLELSSKFTEGEYTITVTGVSDKELTAKVTAANEKVAKIEILTQVAPLVDLGGSDTDTDIDDVAIPYKVTNQYGEEVTKTTVLEASASPGTKNLTPGTLEVAGNFKVDDTIVVSLIHTETATSAIATLKVGAEAKTAEVAISGLYNKDKKVLNEDSDVATDKFYLLVEGKDQYGNVVNDSKLTSGLLINETGKTYIEVDSFKTIDIDGTSKTALLLKAPTAGIKAGSSVITLISKTTGKNAQFTVTVAEAVRAETINLLAPSLVVADEDTYVQVEAFDKQGNPITDVKTLNHATKGVKVTIGSHALLNPFELKDKVVNIKIPKADIGATKGLISILAVPASNKVASLTLNVQDKAVPTVIRGVDSDFSKTLKASQSKTLAVSNLVVEDQYGRVMEDAAVTAYLAGGKVISVVEADESAGALNIAAGNFAGAGNVTIVAGTANGTEKVSLFLNDGTNNLAASEAIVELRVTDGTEYKSYSVDKIGTVYDENGATKTDSDDYDKAIKVYGVLNDGSKVQLTNLTDYTITATNATVNTDVYDSTLDVDAVTANPYGYGTDKTEVVVPVTVTINKTAQQFVEDVTISKAAPKVTAVKFVKSNATDAGTVTTLTVAPGSNFSIATVATGVADTTNLVVTDQYGVSKVVSTTGAVTFADGTSITAPLVVITPVTGSVTINSNGLNAANVVGSTLAANEEFDVKVIYAGGVTATIRVKAE